MHEEVCHASSSFSSFSSSSSIALLACVIPVALPTLIAGTEGTVKKKPFQKENFLDTFLNSLYVFCKDFFKSYSILVFEMEASFSVASQIKKLFLTGGINKKKGRRNAHASKTTISRKKSRSQA